MKKNDYRLVKNHGRHHMTYGNTFFTQNMRQTDRKRIHE